MPSSSQQAGTVASFVIAILGLLFVTRKVVRAKTVGSTSSASASSSSSSSSSSTSRGGANAGGKAGIGGGGGRPASSSEKLAFAVGLLDIAIPRDDRPGGTFPRVMVNDACITKAVQEVSRKLVVSLRDTDSLPPGVVRAYVSEIYQEVYDAACAVRRPYLDVRVLLPTSAVKKSSSNSRTGSPSYAGNRINGEGSRSAGDGSPVNLTDQDRDSSRSSAAALRISSSSSGSSSGLPVTKSATGWASREAAELAPDVEVFFSDEVQGDGERKAALNAERTRVGCLPVDVVSLESVAKGAYKAEYFYAENTLAEIPTFSSVACGGTFDRLHGGHKKLLTLAASICADGTLTVGVTSDSMLKKKSNAHLLNSLSERLEGVSDFLRTLNPQMRMRVEEITDPFGPPVAEEAFDAIVVSSETVSGAERINELRAQKGFRPLAVAVTRRMAAATLSSSYLRRVAEQKERDEEEENHDSQRNKRGRLRK